MERCSPYPKGYIHSAGPQICFFLREAAFWAVEAQSLEVLGDTWRSWGRRPGFGLLLCKALSCWEGGEPCLTRPTLAVPDELSVLQKHPVTVGFSSKGHRQEGTAEETDSISLKGWQQWWGFSPPAEHPSSPFCTAGAFQLRSPLAMNIYEKEIQTYGCIWD